MEIQNLLNQLGHELDLQQQQNQNQINYLRNENQKLKNNLSIYKQNLIELASFINKIANDIDDFKIDFDEII